MGGTCGEDDWVGRLPVEERGRGKRQSTDEDARVGEGELANRKNKKLNEKEKKSFY